MDIDDEAARAMARADRAEYELQLLEARPDALQEKRAVLKERLKAVEAQIKAHPDQVRQAAAKAARLRRIADAHKG